MLKRSSTIHVDHLRDADDLWWRGFDGTSGQAWLQARPTTTFGMALAYCPIPLEVSTGTDDTYITRILASIVTEAYNVLGYNTSWHCKPRERKKVFTVPLPSAIRQQCGARVQGAWPVLGRSLRDLRGHHFRLKQDEVCFKNWVVFFTLLLVVWTAQRRVSLSRKRWKKVMISKHVCVLRQFREVRVYSSHSRVLATVKSWINHQNTQDFQGGHRADWIFHQFKIPRSH